MKLYAILLLVPFCFGGIIHPEDSSQDETSPEYDNNASEDENSSEYENRTMIPVRGIIDRPPTFPVMRNSQEQWSYVVSKIDNFNANSGTYRQRFIYNTQFAKPNGPIFVYVGGEWTIGVGSLSSGQNFSRWRVRTAAPCLPKNTRFYGESIPTVT
ncbi:uncharacterized protein [Atheta coriaria]|uniref:uncharacterized protein n=1 Tax=Dalotia coriaria TaxID=877792 RepID=UPI0031F349E8